MGKREEEGEMGERDGEEGWGRRKDGEEGGGRGNGGEGGGDRLNQRNPEVNPDARPSNACAVLPSPPKGPQLAGPPARGWLVDKSGVLSPTSQPRAGAGGFTCLVRTVCVSVCVCGCKGEG